MCYLVVTARHEVRNCCHSLLEVEGLTKTDAEELIKKYFQEKKDLAEELVDKLDSDENPTRPYGKSTEHSPSLSPL